MDYNKMQDGQLFFSHNTMPLSCSYSLSLSQATPPTHPDWSEGLWWLCSQPHLGFIISSYAACQPERTMSYKAPNRKRTRPSKMEVKQSGIIEQLDVHGHKERLDERDAFSEFVLPIFLSILNHLEPSCIILDHLGPSWTILDHEGPSGIIKFC